MHMEDLFSCVRAWVHIYAQAKKNLMQLSSDAIKSIAVKHYTN